LIDPSNYGYFKSKELNQKKMYSKVSILCRFFHETHQFFEISEKLKTRGYLISEHIKEPELEAL